MDFSITRFISLVKEYRDYVPHGASIRTHCKVFNIDLDAYLRVGIDQPEDKNIYPNIQKLNASMRVQNSRISSKDKEYCLVTPQVFNENGNIVYEKSKFSVYDLGNCIYIQPESYTVLRYISLKYFF